MRFGFILTRTNKLTAFSVVCGLWAIVALFSTLSAGCKSGPTKAVRNQMDQVKAIYFCADPRMKPSCQPEKLKDCHALVRDRQVASLVASLKRIRNTQGALGGYNTAAKARNLIVFVKKDGSCFWGDFIDPTLRLKVGGMSNEYEISGKAGSAIRENLKKTYGTAVR